MENYFRFLIISIFINFTFINTLHERLEYLQINLLLFSERLLQVFQTHQKFPPIHDSVWMIVIIGHGMRNWLNERNTLHKKCSNKELFQVRIFLYSDWISVFSLNTGKCRPYITPNFDTFHLVTVSANRDKK